MERYEVYSVIPIKCIKLYLKNYHSDELKIFDLHQEDLVSILYIDDLNEIGKKEYQIDCRVIDIECNVERSITKEAHIKYVPNCIMANNMKSSELYISAARLKVDCGDKRRAEIRYLDSDNILDIEKYPHKFDLDENPELLPKIIDGFVVNELKTPQQIDVGITSPLTGLNEKIFGKED